MRELSVLQRLQVSDPQFGLSQFGSISYFLKKAEVLVLSNLCYRISGITAVALLCAALLALNNLEPREFD